MKIPHLYRVWNVETGEVFELCARNNLDAICKCPGGPESDPFTGPFRTEEIRTPEGYYITFLRNLPMGMRFNLVGNRGKGPTHPRTFTRGAYNRSAHLYECSHFDTIKHWRLLNGNHLVTVDKEYIQ